MAEGVSILEQFTRFGTDAYGLERLLRLAQSLVQLLLSYPSLIPLLLLILPASNNPTAAASALSQLLPPLRNRLATLRRPFRLFRFLDAFASAWGAWQATTTAAAASSPSSSSPPPSKEGTGWAAGDHRAQARAVRAQALLRCLDAGARSLNAMYLLLESATFAEALDVPGLGVWGEGRARALAVEAQRFWFLALVCAVLAGAARVFVLAAEGEQGGAGGGVVAEPAAVGGEGAEGTPGGAGDGDGMTEKEETEGGGGEEGERKRMEKAAATGTARKERNRIARRLAADVMDLAVPGSVIGWVPFSPGVVSLLMLGSTVLTGLEVWERCGREVAAAKGARGN